MTKDQQDRLKVLTQKMMSNYYFCEDFTEQDYEEYCKLERISHNEYRQREEPRLKEYFNQHFEGKTWEQIDKYRWDFYSDWHKDVFGYRPRSISINAEGR